MLVSCGERSGAFHSPSHRGVGDTDGADDRNGDRGGRTRGLETCGRPAVIAILGAAALKARIILSQDLSA